MLCCMEAMMAWLQQVLNLVPWGGVALALPPVALADAEGWAAVGRGVAAVYINDITSHQVQGIRCGTRHLLWPV